MNVPIAHKCPRPGPHFCSVGWHRDNGCHHVAKPGQPAAESRQTVRSPTTVVSTPTPAAEAPYFVGGGSDNSISPCQQEGALMQQAAMQLRPQARPKWLTQLGAAAPRSTAPPAVTRALQQRHAAPGATHVVRCRNSPWPSVCSKPPIWRRQPPAVSGNGPSPGAHGQG